MFNSANLQPGQVIERVSQSLVVVRNAMNVADNLYAWSSGISPGDLEGIGMAAGDAQALLSACADTWGHAQLYRTGTDPRNPPANYNYGASQRLIIGPRLM